MGVIFYFIILLFFAASNDPRDPASKGQVFHVCTSTQHSPMTGTCIHPAAGPRSLAATRSFEARLHCREGGVTLASHAEAYVCTSSCAWLTIVHGA